MRRPILIAIIGYLLGIIEGQYFSKSVVFLYFPIFAVYQLYQIFIRKKVKRKRKFKLISFHRYFRYFKLFIPLKVFYTLIFISILSNTIFILKNNAYEKIYQLDGEKVELIAKVVSSCEEREFANRYQIKIQTSSQKVNFTDSILYFTCSKKEKKLQYGDKIKIKGTYQAPEQQRNYGGFDQRVYFKQRKIAGTIENQNFNLLAWNHNFSFFSLLDSLKKHLEDKIDFYFSKEVSSVLKALLLGDTNCIEKEKKEDFQNASLSHVLAVSGMHISYLILGMKLCLEKRIGKRKNYYLMILVLLFYMGITGASPSVVRARNRRNLSNRSQITLSKK